MTSFDDIYDIFLSKVLDDEWEHWSEEELRQDLKAILEEAISWFKFPKHSLDFTDEGFQEELTNDEKQIIASYMRAVWLNRNILTWENVKPLYEERDFSQANLLDKFRQLLSEERKIAKQLESKYYRSINYKPFHYRDMGTHIE